MDFTGNHVRLEQAWWIKITLMNSDDLARYIEDTNGISKPWLLAQLRLKKLQEQKSEMNSEDYAAALADIHQDLMQLGEWWVGMEDQVF
jgi:hypothetical protein